MFRAFPFLVLLVIFTTFVSLGSTTCEDDAVLTLIDDAAQYSTKWNPFAKDYKEWWFFTFSDPVADVAFCMGYAYGQPTAGELANMSVIGGMYWPAMQADASSIIYIQDNFTNSGGSRENATMNVGPNDKIRVLDETTYVIEGLTKDGTLQWNLTYTQLVPGMREIFELTYVELDWISYMPLASVEGEVIYKGNKIPVNAFGYHDHNWGVWPTSIFNWVWAQYGDASNKFAIVMGAYNVVDSGDYIGYVFVRVNGTKAKIGTLCGDKYTLVPLKFEEWNGHKYSVQNQVEVKGKEWWLQVNYTTITSGLNPGAKGLHLLVFEQVSQYNVSLWQTNGAGGWNLAVSSSGHGFNEWSDVISL